MYSEIIETPRSKKKDIVTICMLILLIIVIELLAVKLSGVMPVVIMACQGVVFLAIVVLCVYIYMSRISSIRYSIITGEDNIDEPEKYADIERGTIAIERTVGGNGNVLEVIEPSELVGLYKPGEAVPEKTMRRKHRMMTIFPKNTACTLVFRRKNTEHCLYMHPSDEMVGHILSAIANK